MIFLALMLSQLTAPAPSVEVAVNGIGEAKGAIRCALFDASLAEDFPTSTSKVRTVVARIDKGQARCVFANVAPGAYAVSVAHDVNNNGKLDTKIFGIPTEPWGVSNNVRHTMRAPRFSEAKFQTSPGKNHRIQVSVKL